MPERSRSGPDFLCVGMQKAGTQWLYDQLASSPKVWMPPIKELNFWKGKFAKPSNLKQLETMRTTGKDLDGAEHPETPGFVDYLQRLGDAGPQTMSEYLGLFRFKAARLSGDISPVYATATEEETAEVARNLSDARVVLLVRHPVDRIKSALSMHVRKEKIPEDILTDWPRLEALVNREAYRRRSYPTKTWHAWHRSFGDRAQFWFFDDIVLAPERVRAEIAAHIGLANPEFGLPANFNRKAAKQKYRFTPAVEAGLFRLLHQEIRDCSATFKHHATAWQTAPD